MKKILLALLLAPALASAQGIARTSAVTGNGYSSLPITAPQIVATDPSLVSTFAGGITTDAKRVTGATPIHLFSSFPGVQTNAVVGGAYPALEAPFCFTAMKVSVSGASGGGAGVNTVHTVSDGTNTCTFTLACTSSNSTGAYNVTAVNGTGTGCCYAAAANITDTVASACTTTQPTYRTSAFVGRWK